MFTTTTPVPLYWVAHGTPGAPPLLVLHGGPGAHHDYLLPQMLALGAEHALLFYDQRGGGQSKGDSRELVTWHDHVADLALVARELAAEPLTLVGYSWGGLLAMLYAIEAATDASLPAPVRLVLIDPAPVTRQLRRQFEEEFARRQQGDAIGRLRAALGASGLRERDPAAYRQRAFEVSLAGYFARPERAHDLTPFRVMGRVQESVWESLGDYDIVDALGTVRCPALVVHGREDPIPLASSEAAAQALGARLVVLEACGHVPYVEQPQGLFAAIGNFLAETRHPER